VWNANGRDRPALEFDVSSPLYLVGLSIKASAAYTNARLTKDISSRPIDWETSPVARGSNCRAAQDQRRGDDQLRSQYFLRVQADAVRLNDTYRSAMPLSTFPSLGQARALEVQVRTFSTHLLLSYATDAL